MVVFLKLKLGKCVCIVVVNGFDLCLCLLEMGLIEGSEVEVFFCVFFGDLIVVFINGYIFFMWFNEVDFVELEVGYWWKK